MEVAGPTHGDIAGESWHTYSLPAAQAICVVCHQMSLRVGLDSFEQLVTGSNPQLATVLLSLWG